MKHSYFSNYFIIYLPSIFSVIQDSEVVSMNTPSLSPYSEYKNSSIPGQEVSGETLVLV